MTDDTQEPGTPGYKSRRVLMEENEQLKSGLDKLLARVEALEANPPSAAPMADQIVAALRQDREEVLSAKLQRELNEANRQIQDLKLQETPVSGVHYSGYVQAKVDCWDPLNGYKCGPKEGAPGEVFQITMDDYWPGCPFVPVILKGHDFNGRPIVEPHPDFASH